MLTFNYIYYFCKIHFSETIALMKFASRLIVFFILNIGFVACSLMPDELKTAEQLIETAPDSALNILQHMPPGSYTSDKSRALYGLLMSEALERKKLPGKPDSLLDFSIAYYLEHPDNNRLAACYLYKGRIYNSVFQYEDAMNCYLKALDAIAENDDYVLLGRINFDLADIYSMQNDYALARRKYRITYDNFSKTNFQSQAFYALFNIGRTYFLEKDYRKAQTYYRKIYTSAKDSVQQGVLIQEMGLTFYKSGQLDSALVYYKKAIKYPYIGNHKAIRCNLLAQLYFDLEKMDSSFYYASAAFKYAPPIRTQRECYRIMTNCDFARGRTDDVTLYMNRYVALGDSIRKIDSQIKGSYIESMHEAKLEIVKTKSKLGYLIALFLLGIAITYYVIYRIRHQTKTVIRKSAEEHVEQKTRIHKEVVLKQRDALLRKIEVKKNALSAQWKKASVDERRTMYIEMYEELLHFNNTGFFYKEMDAVLNNLVTKLQTKYPGLNVKEIQWCCLHLLNIPVNDIMLLLDYNIEGLKKMRQRLAKKVDIHYVSHIDDFLNSILIE